MPQLELTPDRLSLLLETVEEALGVAEEVLQGILDDKLPETREDHVALFDVQMTRVEDLRELLQELKGKS